MTTSAPALELSEEQFNALLHLAELYRRQALKCLDAKAYLAGSVMVGAALEASLMVLIHVRGEQVMTWQHLPKKRGAVKPLLEWDLSAALLRAADYAGWLPRQIPDDHDFSHRKAAHGDYGKIIHTCRNLVHPTRYLEDFGSLRMTRKRLDFLLDILGYLGKHLAAVVFRPSELEE